AERLVHRHKRLPEPRDARLVAQALAERLSERDAAVLDRVVAVHLQVALAGERQAEAAVHGKAVEHMVKKADAGVDSAFAARKVEGQLDIGFLGFALDFSLSHPVCPPQSALQSNWHARPDARSA